MTKILENYAEGRWVKSAGGLSPIHSALTGDVVAENLSMPHSPRIHPGFPGKLWMLHAGTGAR